ncbi:hypothetical protein D3C72_2573650 [compost metagenome]
MDGPNIRYSGTKLEVSATPEQFADIEAPLNIQTDLNVNPLGLNTVPLDEVIQKL